MGIHVKPRTLINILTAGAEALGDPGTRVNADAIHTAMAERIGPDLRFAAAALSPINHALRTAAGFGKNTSFPKWLASPIRTRTEVHDAFTTAVEIIASTDPARIVTERSGGGCEANTGERCRHVGVAFHHVRFESQGGPWSVDNLIHVCKPCHTWIHRNIAEAIRLGVAHPDTPLDLLSEPTCWYLVRYADGRTEVTSRNKARKARRRTNRRASDRVAVIERLPADDPRIPNDLEDDEQAGAA